MPKHNKKSTDTGHREIRTNPDTNSDSLSAIHQLSPRGRHELTDRFSQHYHEQLQQSQSEQQRQQDMHRKLDITLPSLIKEAAWKCQDGTQFHPQKVMTMLKSMTKEHVNSNEETRTFLKEPYKQAVKIFNELGASMALYNEGTLNDEAVQQTWEKLGKKFAKNPLVTWGAQKLAGKEAHWPHKQETKHATFSDSGIRETMRKWNDIQRDVDDLKAIEVYPHLSKEQRRLFEKQSNTFENLDKDILSGTKQDNHLEEAIQAFDTLNAMKESVKFEQKVYDITRMTSEQFLSTEATDQVKSDIQKKIASTAKKEGWKSTMEKVTEVFQRLNDPKNEDILTAIEDQADESAAEDLVKMLLNERIDKDLRINIGYAICTLRTVRDIKYINTDNSVTKDLVEMIPNNRDNTSMCHMLTTVLPILNDRSVAGRLKEIRDSNQTNASVQRKIDGILQKWYE